MIFTAYIFRNTLREIEGEAATILPARDTAENVVKCDNSANRTIMVSGTRLPMNEIKLVLLGLVVLVFSVVLLWIFEAPEIIEDKEVQIVSTLGIGLLILVLNKRSERDLHEKIHQQHDIINKMSKLIHEQHEFVMDLGNKR
jgi:hypothetical protein